ncbi:hypothetical protein AVEN_83025-1, partial [Araneus ventricosus]
MEVKEMQSSVYYLPGLLTAHKSKQVSEAESAQYYNINAGNWSD